MSITTAGRGRRTGRSTSRPAGTSRRTISRRPSPTSSARSRAAMTRHIIKTLTTAGSMAVLAAATVVPVLAHHSFAMYDQTKTVTLTGVVRQFVAQANHAELHFILIAPDRKGLAKSADGKYVEW